MVFDADPANDRTQIDECTAEIGRLQTRLKAAQKVVRAAKRYVISWLPEDNHHIPPVNVLNVNWLRLCATVNPRNVNKKWERGNG